MNMQVQITKAKVILTSFSTDHVCLYTVLPSPINYLQNEELLVLKFEATANKGVDYVRNTFQLEPEVIDLRRKIRK